MDAFFRLAREQNAALTQCRKEDDALLKLAREQYQTLTECQRESEALRSAIAQLVAQALVTPEQLRALRDDEGRPLLDVFEEGASVSIEASPAQRPPPRVEPEARPASPPAPARRRIAPKVTPFATQW